MDQSNGFMMIGFYLFGIVISAFIFALVFNVSKHIKLLKIQVELLSKIAEKSGVSMDEVSEIVNR